jgi:hypothetical protein
VWFSGKAFQQRCRKSRLANASLTGEQDYLALAGFCFGPTSQQQVEFFFPADEVGQATGVESIEAAFNRSLSQCRPGSRRPRNALEVLCSEVLKLEQITKELSRIFGNDHAVGLCNSLQARRKVRRLTNNASLLRLSGADQVADDHKTRCDADARLEGRMGLQSANSSDQLQPRTHCPFCVVFVCLGVAEVDQHPVAHVLGYEAAEALHGLGDTLLVAADNLAEVFGVHARREGR